MDHALLVNWARQHQRLSVDTIRRRFRLPRSQAESLIAELIRERVLSREPEGDSYRVLYSRRRQEHPEWFNPQGNPDRRNTQALAITPIVRTPQQPEGRP